MHAVYRLHHNVPIVAECILKRRKKKPFRFGAAIFPHLQWKQCFTKGNNTIRPTSKKLLSRKKAALRPIFKNFEKIQKFKSSCSKQGQARSLTESDGRL